MSACAGCLYWTLHFCPLLSARSIGYAMCAKPRAQRFIGPEQQRFDGGFRTAQHRRDLRILHLLVFVHQYRRALLRRQRFDRLPDLLESSPAAAGSARWWRTGPAAGVPRHPGGSSSRLSCAFSCRTIPHPVQRQMCRDTEKPSGELGRRLIGGARSIDPKKNFLRQLLRDSLVLHHPIQEMNHRRSGGAPAAARNWRSRHPALSASARHPVPGLRPPSYLC